MEMADGKTRFGSCNPFDEFVPGMELLVSTIDYHQLSTRIRIEQRNGVDVFDGHC